MLDRLRSLRAGDGYERWERRTDGPLLWIAMVLLVALLIPLLANITPAQDVVLGALSAVIWLAFTVDYLARLYLSSGRLHFVRTHLLDLVVIVLPLLRPLRAFRLLTLLRGVSLLGLAHQHAGRSLHARVGTYVCAATAVVVVVLAVIMYSVEQDAPGANIKTFGDAAWWAFTTVTTVGYGDRYPTTGGGRLVAVTLMLVGIALLGVVTASVAAWFVGRLQAAQAVEERTGATVADLLKELRELRAVVDGMRHESASRAAEHRQP